ncbi:hypothetical protein ACFE04_013226 [Oxalis oulophora]
MTFYPEPRSAEILIALAGDFILIICWEWSTNLYQVIFTQRIEFAPTEKSKVINPSETLLSALEKSSCGSFQQYLAYHDLSMLCESNNVDNWRINEFYKDNGKIYTRVISACLRPLEKLTNLQSERVCSHQLMKSETMDNIQVRVTCSLNSI